MTIIFTKDFQIVTSAIETVNIFPFSEPIMGDMGTVHPPRMVINQSFMADMNDVHDVIEQLGNSTFYSPDQQVIITQRFLDFMEEYKNYLKDNEQ